MAGRLPRAATTIRASRSWSPRDVDATGLRPDPGKTYYDVSVPIIFPCYYDLWARAPQRRIRAVHRATHKYLEGALALARSGGTIRLESARRAELETLSSESKQRSLAKLMVRRFQRELAVSESFCVHAINATPRAGKLRFSIQEKVAAALSDSPRLTPSPDKAASGQEHGRAADLVEVPLGPGRLERRRRRRRRSRRPAHSPPRRPAVKAATRSSSRSCPSAGARST